MKQFILVSCGTMLGTSVLSYVLYICGTAFLLGEEQLTSQFLVDTGVQILLVGLFGAALMAATLFLLSKLDSWRSRRRRIRITKSAAGKSS